MRSFQSGAKQGLFSLGGVLLTFSFLTSLLTHVVVVVALGYYSVYLTTAPLLVASSILFLAKSCVDKDCKPRPKSKIVQTIVEHQAEEQEV